MESNKQQEVDETVELLKRNSEALPDDDFPGEDYAASLRDESSSKKTTENTASVPEIVFETSDLLKRIVLVFTSVTICGLIGVFLMIKFMMTPPEKEPGDLGLKNVMAELVEIKPVVMNLKSELASLKGELSQKPTGNVGNGALQVKLLSIEAKIESVQKSIQDLDGSLANHRTNAAAQFTKLQEETRGVIAEFENFQTKPASVDVEPSVPESKGYRYKFKRVNENN
tara:strand:+ start:106032 stop:106712 length:681 start_codon:yes stop_codon:yes gene_type:complete